jgi:hypothetical protein
MVNSEFVTGYQVPETGNRKLATLVCLMLLACQINQALINTTASFCW